MANVLPKFAPRQPQDRKAQLKQMILRREAEFGGQMFGPVPAGHQRQFFCLDEHTWVWHESWLDKKGHRQSITTRYDVRPNGIIKSQNGQVYQRLSKQELANFYRAARRYRDHVNAEYQQLLQSA
jgi:hypothetical protein